ncbi:lipase family protein [Nocardia arizonensis]|uniref:lipase family protein n=1 Tax=Nocardia arizonensis TaxID=1141647 RepID=UPI0006CF2BB4|nr:lipase family protein [Nocardia arizonensis]
MRTCHEKRGPRTIFAAVLAVAAIASAPLPPAVADPGPSESDPFYVAPAELAGYPDGAVLRTRSIALFGLPLPISAWQVLYRSTDSRQRPVAQATTVMVADLPWLGGGPRPVLSYQVAVDSLGARCAPSRTLRGSTTGGFNTLIDSPFMAAALLRGWAVVTSDYDGQDARFLDGVNAGRGVLDGIRAALAFGAGGIGPAGPVAAYGYSGGAYASLWAAELQPAYAPEVRLVGVSAGGVPADWTAIARHVDGTGQAGLAVLIVHAVTRNNPEAGIGALLNARGAAMLAEDGDACGEDLLPKYRDARVEEFASVPDLLSQPNFRAALAAQELGGAAPSTPMYLYHSASDEVIPADGFIGLVGRYCALGAAVTHRLSPLPGHNPTAVVEFGGAFDYLADRFAGRPVAPGCRVR